MFDFVCLDIARQVFEALHFKLWSIMIFRNDNLFSALKAFPCLFALICPVLRRSPAKSSKPYISRWLAPASFEFQTYIATFFMFAQQPQAIVWKVIWFSARAEGIAFLVPAWILKYVSAISQFCVCRKVFRFRSVQCKENGLSAWTKPLNMLENR